MANQLPIAGEGDEDCARAAREWGRPKSFERTRELACNVSVSVDGIYCPVAKA